MNWLGLYVPYDYASMPSWYSMLPRMLFCLMCEDTWHYWAHRLLHHKSLYGPIHKLHHQFNVPFGLAAEYAHPIETLTLGVGFFLPLPFVCNHLFVFWCWLAVRMVQTTDVHSGFDFPWLNPLYLLPFYGGVRFHDFHHSYFNANYVSNKAMMRHTADMKRGTDCRILSVSTIKGAALTLYASLCAFFSLFLLGLHVHFLGLAVRHEPPVRCG